jgi:uncharacterized membrane protein YkvA (DUF1232 family)
MWKKRLTLWWTLLRGDAGRLWRAWRHPATPAWFKGGTLLLALYLLSPVDLLPDAIPVLGVVDDLVLLPLALRWLLSRLPAALQRELERRRPAAR